MSNDGLCVKKLNSRTHAISSLDLPCSCYQLVASNDRIYGICDEGKLFVLFKVESKEKERPKRARRSESEDDSQKDSRSRSPSRSRSDSFDNHAGGFEYTHTVVKIDEDEKEESEKEEEEKETFRVDKRDDSENSDEESEEEFQLEGSMAPMTEGSSSIKETQGIDLKYVDLYNEKPGRLLSFSSCKLFLPNNCSQ